MSAKHTPGPWFTKREGFSTVYVEARLRAGVIQEVAACGPTEAGSEQQEANASLIAAAPELLDALQAAVGCGMVPASSASEGGAVRHAAQVHVADQIRAAIAKAIGSAA